MNIIIERIVRGDHSCLGTILLPLELIEWYHQGRTFLKPPRQRFYTLEDLPRKHKIKNQTAIWEGTYPLELRYKGGLYEKYCKRFKEDHPMLWIRRIPDFRYVYIHPFNKHTETSGCVGPGMDYKFINNDYEMVESKPAYKKIYYPIKLAIESGIPITVTVREHRQNMEAIFRDKGKVEPEIIPVKETISEKDIKPKVKVSWFEHVIIGNIVKGILNFIFQRSTGFRVFKIFKDDMTLFKNKTKSIWDWLVELIKTLITKLRGKQNG